MASTAGSRSRDATFEAIYSAPEWRSFIALINGWYRQPISEATGVPADDLSWRERVTGRPLPAILWEWYRLFGRHESVRDRTCVDFVVRFEYVWMSKRYLHIYGENQDGWSCGVLEEHRDQPDPPVYFDSRAMPVEDLGFPLEGLELVDGHFIPVCDKLSDFLLCLAARQIIFRGEPSPFFRAGVRWAENPHIFGLAPLERMLKFPAGFDLYRGDDVFAMDGWGFAARTPEAWARLR